MPVKIPLFATIFMIIAVAILCALGVWQLQRLQWKEGLIAQTQLPPVRISRATDLRDDLHFRRVVLQGRFQPEAEILVEPVIGSGHLYTAFVLRGGGTLWVNRGAIKTHDYKAALPPPANITEITGQLARAPQASFFKPPNEPQQRRFYSVNPQEMAALYSLPDIQPYILYQQNADNPPLTPFQPVLRNDHLQYALFWFAMAGICAGIYALRFLRKPA